MTYRRHTDYDEGSGATIASVGLCATVVVTVVAFCVAQIGLFEKPPFARVVFIDSGKPLPAQSARGTDGSGVLVARN